MQDIDRVAHVERFAEPAWTKRVRIETKPRVLIPRSERANRIAGDRWRSRHVGEQMSVWCPEPQLTVGPSLDLISLLVDGAVMAPAQHREVRQRGGPALGPVTDVMALTEGHAAPLCQDE